MGGGVSAARRILIAAALVATAVGTVDRQIVEAAPNFDASPTDLSFPSLAVGGTATIPVVVTNVSGSPQGPISMAGGAPGEPNFGGSQDCQGQMLAPGGTCAVTYTFQPQSIGTHSTDTSFSINGESFSITMSGTATSPFSVAPTNLLFADTEVGDTIEIPVVVTNVSGSPQGPISMAGGAPGEPNFNGSQNCQGQILAAGATCQVTYTFQPQSIGTHSTDTSFSINGESFSITMSGTGVDPGGAATTPTTEPGDPTDTTDTSDVDDTAAPGTVTTVVADPSGGPLPGATIDPSAPNVDPIPAPVIDGDGHVIAQGIVEFGNGSFAWDHLHLDHGGWPLVLDASPPAFIVADGPDALLLSDTSGPVALVDAGEAAFVDAGTSGAVTPLFDGAFAAGRRITFVSGAGDGSFAPGSGARDVNLVAGAITADRPLVISSPFPVLVIVTAGDVVDAGGTSLAVDTPMTLEPDVELTTAGPEAATVLVAAVGGPVT